MKRTMGIWLVAALLAGLAGNRATAADWPAWRCDAARSGATAEQLADTLYPQWVLPLPESAPAWPNEPRLGFDVSYEPVAAAGLLVVGSSLDGSVMALDGATGAVRWKFSTEGPVRFAPVVGSGKVYAGSDDGYLYCLSLAEGKLLWKVRGAPDDRPERHHLGNGRLVSFWPVRGGPVLAEGRVYFAAGIWPTLGVFVAAIDAETGQIAWRNSELGLIDQVRLDHNQIGTSGLSPQGYLLVHGDTLLVPNGRSMPAGLDRNSGKLRYYLQGYRNGDCRVAAAEQVALVGEAGVVDVRTGREMGSRWAAAGPDAPRGFDPSRVDLFEGPIHPYKFVPGCSWRSVLADGMAYGLEGGTFYAYDLRQAKTAEYESKSGDRVLKPWRWDPPPAWKLATDKAGGGPAMPLVKAGNRLYGCASKTLVAVSIPAGSEPPRIAWQLPLDGDASSMLAAEGRLYVVSKDGRIFCFGPQKTEPAVVKLPAAESPAPEQEAVRTATALLGDVKISEGYCVLLGLKSRGLAGELLRQSSLKVIGIDPDAGKVNALRAALAAEGLYGKRAELFVGEPAEFSLPPYLASLVVVEDPEALGFPKDRSAPDLFEHLRPYGGTACLAMPAERQAAFAAWVAAAGLESAEVGRSGDFAIVRRVGPLPGSASWTHECADPARSYFSHDRRVKTPLCILWYGDGPDYGFWKSKDYGTGVKPQVIGGRVFAFQIDTRTLIAYDAFTGRQLWRQPVDPFTRYASLETGIYVAGGNKLRVLDPASGGEVSAWAIEIEPGKPAFVSDVRVADDVVVVALAPEKVRVIEQGLWDSTTLVTLDRATGNVLWKRTAEFRFNNHALAVGAGLVFAIDSLSPIEGQKLQRLGKPPSDELLPSKILAMDARTGEVRWSIAPEKPYRTYGMGGWTAMRANDDWLAFAAGSNLLLAGKFNRAAAYEAASGKPVWDGTIGGGQPWILRGDSFLPQSGAAFDVRTGKPLGRQFPLDRGGCNYAVASEFLILLRDRSASFVESDTGRKQALYAVRSGCSNSLIAADGVLSVPNFAVGCVCNYPIQTSFAMVHQPEAAAWLTTTPAAQAVDPRKPEAGR